MLLVIATKTGDSTNRSYQAYEQLGFRTIHAPFHPTKGSKLFCEHRRHKLKVLRVSGCTNPSLPKSTSANSKILDTRQGNLFFTLLYITNSSINKNQLDVRNSFSNSALQLASPSHPLALECFDCYSCRRTVKWSSRHQLGRSTVARNTCLVFIRHRWCVSVLALVPKRASHSAYFALRRITY